MKIARRRIQIPGGVSWHWTATMALLSALGASLFLPSHPGRAADDALAQVEPIEPDVHEFMEYMFEPTYQRLKGEIAKLASNESPWKALKADSLVLAEGTNLLLGRGPDEQRADWLKHAVAARHAAGEVYRSAKAKDAAKTKNAYATMIRQCNACHKHFAEGEHQLEP
jgi:hypothetical protein